MIVVDASVLVSALADQGRDARWAAEHVAGSRLAAPHHAVVEVANVLRRLEGASLINSTAGALAHHDLVALRIDLYPYRPFAARVWVLRHNVTAYDAAYLALAEALDIPLVTLDRRMAGAPGPSCEILVPPRS
ncbi:type II toxin-antitoxin system VapC family toxin [Iamia sp.]|uniref:type II toxin-antitoxin system VapC family toxin n=1 Tax=Iamia sp. TaxID=2722710 RepID=UPI002BDAFBA1|nr:type II toxin-antitoxin system VapC family toxin [Iamia sp.]HXH57526.1 type II toxin-antitoxin system VapC family toxin [Iamia sp.]